MYRVFHSLVVSFPWNKIGNLSCAAAAVAVLLALAAPGRTATVTWDANGADPPNGTFSVANNWNPNQVPVAGDTAVFSLDKIYTVTLTANAASDVLQMNAGGWLS
jgi:hypothetical protein